MADKRVFFCKMIFSSIRDMIRSTSGRSISRILSGRSLCLGKSSIWATRHRAARCSLPGAVRRRAVSHRPWTISPLLGLAPGGGYLAACITANAGGLLHHLFTITTQKGWLFVSVALSGGFPRPGCYPTPCSMECGLSSIPTTQNRNCPTNLRWLHHTRWRDESQPWQAATRSERWTFQEKTLK